MSRQAWSIAYAKQAKVDLDVYHLLIKRQEVKPCQPLHFLQMACEKLCKAHLCGSGTDPDGLQKSHAFIAGPLPGIAREQFTRLGSESLRNRSRSLQEIRQLAPEIELLAPTVTDGGRRPENCEYPWQRGGRVYVPAEYSFPNLDLLEKPAGRLLIRLITAAIDDLLDS